jgi:Exonuclease VII small subunit.
MDNKNDKPTYKEAIEKLETILEKIENPDLPLSKVEPEVKKAIELIKYCRNELKGYNDDFNKILNS